VNPANQKNATTSRRLFTVPAESTRVGFSIREIPWRRIGFYVVFSLSFFLLGAVPMWLKVRDKAADLAVVQRELGLSQMENDLSEAVIDTRRGDYEPARQTASDFFTGLRNQVDKKENPAISSNQRERLKGLLMQRDDIITLLARGEPAAADRLSNFYVAYRQTMNGWQPSNGNTK
jgi:predicted exporter